MTTRSEREKAQKLNEQHQAILSNLLREDDNKYCADCEAKGPRWASWNLGVFMCIRCAGIHRNLGVHISRVKSVNLDQWTPEQIQSMVDMGNSRARQLYEAHLPESFRRPQTDQAVEVFIRDKYERKKYMDVDALAMAPQKSSEAAPSSSSTSSPSSQANRSKPEKEREKKKEEKKREKDADKVERPNAKSESRANTKESSEPAVDLLGLDAPEGGGKSPSGAAATSDDLDIFGPMVSNPLPSSGNKQQSGSSAAAPSPADPSTSSSASSSTSTSTTTKAEQKKLLSKDSILSLYSSSSVGSQPQGQPQPAPGQAGMYMGQPQMPSAQQAFASGMGGAVPPMGGGAMMPNGAYMGIQQQQQQQQGATPVNQGQNMFSVQQGQWNMGQMTQQMSGINVSGGAPAPAAFSQSGAPAAGWPAAAPGTGSGHTLSTQLWK